MIVAGIGYRKAATLADLREALALTGTRPDALASVAAKAGGAVLTELAAELNLPVIAVTESCLGGTKTPTRSARIEGRFGTGCLSEAAALLAAGDGAGARITVTRVKTANGMATAAIAERIPS
ncbi:cobalamin biosynthesis protein [Roseovarius sp. CAU 1744]|uniref:cobalamin biosynthesis protein n=1 Tax=Roseovarius sp. CAU 1744 TaxID=3140368 RepID=UPI00325BCDED